MGYDPAYDNNIVSSRIRLARNVKGAPFRVTDARLADEIIKKIYAAANRVENFRLYRLAPMDALRREALKEKHLVSNALIENSAFSAVLLNSDDSVSVMIHEEDVVREQCIMRGFRLTEAYKRLDRIDDELDKNVDFAFDGNLGYLTACPTNVGTGLRASVMLFLPALTESGQLGSVLKEISRLGLTARGVYGEGSNADGYTYQISNEITLGVSEKELIEGVEEAVSVVCESELDAAETFYAPKMLATENKCRRALAILENSVMLGYDEFINYVSDVRLGVILGFFDFEYPEALDDLIVSARPAVLCERAKRALDAEERDSYRARFVKNSLKIIRGDR